MMRIKLPLHLPKLALILFAVLAGPAGAQTMYRCGNSFSQESCGPGAKVIKTPGAVQSPASKLGPEASAAIAQQCKQRLGALPDWKDRDSVRFGVASTSVAETRTVRGTPMAVRARIIMVDAKNSYGAYTGDRPAFCYTDDAESKVVDVWVPSR